jgi:hypothetical protein
MGPSVVVKAGGVTILLSSRKAPFDLGQLRSQAIEPQTPKAIGVKAAVAHRRAYDRIAKAASPWRHPGPAPAGSRRCRSSGCGLASFQSRGNVLLTARDLSARDMLHTAPPGRSRLV